MRYMYCTVLLILGSRRRKGMVLVIIKKAAGADKLPAEREAEVSARAFAAFIAQPRR